MHGRALPILLAGGACLLGLVAVAAGWLALGGDALADVERELQQGDRYAQFVDRPVPAFTLADADGGSVGLDDFEGRIVILNFIYARCADICPPHMAIIADLQDRIRRLGLADEVEFVTLATDTEDAEETAAVVAGYGQRFGLEPDNWRMLYRGEQRPRTVVDLATEYGLEFRVVTTEDGHDHSHGTAAVERQVHGAVTHVIDPSGRLRARLHGIRFEPETLTTYVRALIARETT